MAKQPSILLLGPTGSGKSPLGDFLEAAGLWGRKCVHFDFGCRLRKSRETAVPSLTEQEKKTVALALDSGAFLEDREFPIALKIFRAFLAEKVVGRQDLVVLNGLPRHPGQAVSLDPLVRIEMVVVLECSAETAFLRIASDAGGDRNGRSDDSVRWVARKLDLYLERTLPLLDHYRDRNVPVLRIPVELNTKAQEMGRTLEKMKGEETMNIFDFAIAKEREAENHYRSMIDRTGDAGLKDILSRLADAEVRHRKIVEEMKTKTLKPELPGDPILKDAKAVFEKMERSHQVPEVPADAAGLYRLSVDMEKASTTFYTEKAKETGNESHQAVFLALADEEKKHLLLAETLVEMVTRPQTWLENAEWHHMNEY